MDVPIPVCRDTAPAVSGDATSADARGRASLRGLTIGVCEYERTDCNTSDIGHWVAMTSDYGGQKKSQAFAWLVVFALPIFLGRPSIVRPSATVRGTVAGIKRTDCHGRF